MFYSLKWGSIYINYLDFLIIYLFLFSLTYIFSHLFVTMLTHIYSIWWVIIQHCYLSLFKLSQVCPLGALQLAAISLSHAPLLWVFFSKFCFLALTRCFGLIFSLPDLKSAISPRSSGFFYWRMVLETSIWTLSGLIGT